MREKQRTHLNNININRIDCDAARSSPSFNLFLRLKKMKDSYIGVSIDISN